MKTVARHPKQHLIETKVILLAVKWETWNSQRKENMTDVVTQSHGTNNEVQSDQFESVQIRNARLSNPTTFIRFTLLTSTYNLCARIKFRSIANIHSYRMVTVIFLHFNHSQRYGRMNQEFLGIFLPIFWSLHCSNSSHGWTVWPIFINFSQKAWWRLLEADDIKIFPENLQI